jgi:hypothetical protein
MVHPAHNHFFTRVSLLPPSPNRRTFPSSHLAALATFEPEEVAHVLSEMQDPSTSNVRRRALARLLGVPESMPMNAETDTGTGPAVDPPGRAETEAERTPSEGSPACGAPRPCAGE